MPLAARIVLALGLLVASDADASLTGCFQLVLPGQQVPQRDYVVEPGSWIAFEGAEPAEISGSLRLRQSHRCNSPPLDRRAYIVSLELTDGSETLTYPPDPVVVGSTRITGEAGYLFRDSHEVRVESWLGVYWTWRTNDGASALLAQWAEPIDEEDAWLHEVWLARDPDGESIIDWTGPDGLPADVDLALRLEARTLHCHLPEVWRNGCTFHESSGAIGALRLIARLPEPTAAASSLAVLTALYALRSRKPRTRSAR